jgi:NAD(P)-dependent dehydrogenase (short-subunit alcohol dehydrogenase family)
MPTVFITGASRGVGAAELDAVGRGQAGSRIEKLPLDVGNFSAIEALAQKLTNRSIDVLLMNAAATGGVAEAFGATDYAAWDRYHRINTQAPMRLAECFAPHVAASQRKIMFAISSRVGARPLYGFVGYRASKSALNQVVFQLSLVLAARDIACACAHPGWVQTRATGNTGVLTPAESAGMLFFRPRRQPSADRDAATGSAQLCEGQPLSAETVR